MGCIPRAWLHSSRAREICMVGFFHIANPLSPETPSDIVFSMVGSRSPLEAFSLIYWFFRHKDFFLIHP